MNEDFICEGNGKSSHFIAGEGRFFEFRRIFLGLFGYGWLYLSGFGLILGGFLGDIGWGILKKGLSLAWIIVSEWYDFCR